MPIPSTPASRSGRRATASRPTAPTTTSIARSTATSTSVSWTSCSRPRLASPPISRRQHLLLRGLPADRGDRAPRPRHAALRPHEADGPRPTRAPDGGPTLWCSFARRILRAESFNLVGFQNHMKFGEQARVLRLIPGLEKRRVPALRPDPPQHVYQRARAPDRHAATCARGPTSSSPGRSPASKATSNPSPPDSWRACTPPRWPLARRPRPLPRATALGSLCHYVSGRRPEGLPARQHHLRPAAAARRGRPPADCAATRRRGHALSLPARAGRVSACLDADRACPSLNSNARSSSYLEDLAALGQFRPLHSRL